MLCTASGGKSNPIINISINEDTLLKLQENLLSERKLKAAKKQLLGQLAISGDNGETQCLSMGKGLLSYGKLNTNNENKAIIEAITADDIRSMAQRIFDSSRLSRLTYI